MERRRIFLLDAVINCIKPKMRLVDTVHLHRMGGKQTLAYTTHIFRH